MKIAIGAVLAGSAAAFAPAASFGARSSALKMCTETATEKVGARSNSGLWDIYNAYRREILNSHLLPFMLIFPDQLLCIPSLKGVCQVACHCEAWCCYWSSSRRSS